MRHRKDKRKLGKTSSHRKAMLRNMVTSFFEHEEIVTTEAKAKELRRLADKLITLAKQNTLSAKREAMRVIKSKEIMRKLFDVIAPRFNNRLGGYTRILKVGFRLGDAAPTVIIKLVV